MKCIQIANLIVLASTFGAIIWYSYETRGMKLQIVRQNELSLRPFIILSFEGNKYYLKNISNVSALNISMGEILIHANAMMNTEEKLAFERVDVIPAGGSKGADIRNSKGETASNALMSHIWPHSAQKSFDFIISYCSIENKIYLTFGKMGKGGVEIEGTKKIERGKACPN